MLLRLLLKFWKKLYKPRSKLKDINTFKAMSKRIINSIFMFLKTLIIAAKDV